MPTRRALSVLLVLLPLAVSAACRRSRSAPPVAETRSPAPDGQATGPQPVAVAPPLLVERFDDAGALQAWQEVDGRVEGTGIGNGSRSTITFADGAVRLEGAADTSRWRSLERTVALGGATWFRMAARMKTDGLVADGVHRPMCYLYARFTDAGGQRVGEVVATRNLLGTTPWTPVARRYPVPAGAANLTVGLFLSLPGRAWFDDVEVSAAAAPAWHEATEGHYRYHWLDGDEIPDHKRRFNSESYRLTAEFLGLDPATGPEVGYFKYPDKAIKEELMGDPGNAFALTDGTMHSIFASDRHEVVHLLARAWGDPPALLGEGLAVHMSGGWQGKSVVAYAKGIADGDWIALADLIDSAAFRARPDLVTYAIAAAFIQWILAQPDGKTKLRALYGKLANRAPAADNRRALEAILGASAADIDSQLRAWLRAQ